MRNELKILSVHSMATHGTASMKVAISLLGSRILPVPSIYLTGLTNIPGFQKFALPFEAMLVGSLELARKRGQKLLLYIGYLANATQAETLSSAIKEYRDIIQHILIDPVSGDHGKIYVAEEVISVWPMLLKQADWALPNYTELQLFSGLAPDRSIEAHVNAFQQSFPNLSFIATSIPFDEDIGLHLYHEGEDWQFSHEKLTHNYGGTGDVFAISFIEAFWLNGLSAKEAVKEGANRCLKLIRKAKDQKADQLIVE